MFPRVCVPVRRGRRERKQEFHFILYEMKQNEKKAKK